MKDLFGRPVVESDAVTETDRAIGPIELARPCQTCGGGRVVPIEHDESLVVTRDMASDAGDPSMEGTSVPWGTSTEWVPCPDCGEVENPIDSPPPLNIPDRDEDLPF